MKQKTVAALLCFVVGVVGGIWTFNAQGSPWALVAACFAVFVAAMLVGIVAVWK